MDRKRAVDIFFRKILASSKSRRINKEDEFLAELIIDQMSAFYENENHIKNAVIVNIARSVEIIVKSRDKKRVVRKANLDIT